MRSNAVGMRMRSSARVRRMVQVDVHRQRPPARLEHAPDLVRRAVENVSAQVMQGQRRHHRVECRA
jgi:hypothetical protein